MPKQAAAALLKFGAWPRSNRRKKIGNCYLTFVSKRNLLKETVSSNYLGAPLSQHRHSMEKASTHARLGGKTRGHANLLPMSFLRRVGSEGGEANLRGIALLQVNLRRRAAQRTLA